MKLTDTITGIQHLGIPVKNMDEAVAFYCSLPGFELVHRKVSLDSAGGAIEAAFVQLGDLVLELFKSVGNEKAAVQRTEGVYDHYAIDAPDFDDCVQMGEEHGLKLHASTADGAVWYKTVGNKGVYGINFCGAAGEVMEFCHNCETDYRTKSGLQGWSHLALKVRSLEESVRFYEGLGFQKCADGYLDTPDGRLIIGFVQLHNFQLELIQKLPGQENNNTEQGHIDHMALDVCDVTEAFRACRQEGYTILHPVIRELSFFEHGIRYFMIEGPDGELIEFNQIIRY